ncbi:MAG: CGNR zinc finger domain-containing protein [Actinobacteria bacterium]|nr:CGNR zinc finger domain-containing protein [Actinomycetota bacterium]
MDFAHYNNSGAVFAEELVNTKGSVSGNEYLPTVEEWQDFLTRFGVKGVSRLTVADVEEIKGFRDRIRDVFFADEEGAIKLLNDILSEVAATPQISNHDGHPWHLHYSSDDAPISHRVAAGAAMGLAVLIVEKGHERLGICAADDCFDVFVDTSRNKSKRYCNQTCCTKVNVAAHRARKKEAGTSS